MRNAASSSIPVAFAILLAAFASAVWAEYVEVRDWAVFTSLRGEVVVQPEFTGQESRGFDSGGGWFGDLAWSKLQAARLGDSIEPDAVILVRDGSAEVHFQVPTVESAEGQRVGSMRLLRHTAVLVSTEDSILSVDGRGANVGVTEGGKVVAIRNGFIDVLHGKVRYAQWDPRIKMSIKMRNLVLRLEGTELEIDYDSRSDRAWVKVLEGKIVLAGPYGSNILQAGQSASYIGGKRQDDPS